MIKNKLKILSFILVAILAQGTFVYASSSSKKGDDDYSKEELENREPGFEWKDIEKSNYNVNKYINSFASSITPEEAAKDDKNDTSKTSNTTTDTTDKNKGNAIVSSVPSTGRQGDFWGKTSDGKWILIEQGIPASGWRNVRGKWYYMDFDGVMQTGWINDGSTWYYLYPSGAMAYNTWVDGYYLDGTGAMR